MITGYICDITISIEVLRDRRKVFSGFIVEINSFQSNERCISKAF